MPGRYPPAGCDCPVERSWSSATILRQPKIPVAGLDPATHVFLGFGDLGGQGVDARIKSGQGGLQILSWPATLDPALSKLLNGTARARRLRARRAQNRCSSRSI